MTMTWMPAALKVRKRSHDECAKWLFAALFVIELFVALADSAAPWLMGRVVTMVTKTPPDQLLALRPAAFMTGHHFLISAVWYAASPAGFC